MEKNGWTKKNNKMELILWSIALSSTPILTLKLITAMLKGHIMLSFLISLFYFFVIEF